MPSNESCATSSPGAYNVVGMENQRLPNAGLRFSEWMQDSPYEMDYDIRKRGLNADMAYNLLNADVTFDNDMGMFSQIDSIPRDDSWYGSMYYDSNMLVTDNNNLMGSDEKMLLAGSPTVSNTPSETTSYEVHIGNDSRSFSEGDVTPQEKRSFGAIRKRVNLSMGKYLKPLQTNSCKPPASDIESANTRPELNEKMISELNDIGHFKNSPIYAKLLVEYSDNISFPLGEGGRELLRACLNVRGCKGRQLQGASVPTLLQLAHQWNLWNIAIRIKVERSTGGLSPAHEAFVKFKANQSQMRKYAKKEYMVTERDVTGRISKIVYDETRRITLGKEGREALRAQLRRLHDKHARRMDQLLEQNGFKYAELRNATVHQLGRMAFVCNLWDQVVGACRTQEEKRDGWKKRKTYDLKLPFNLMEGQQPIRTTNGEMSDEDALRTMKAVNALLQQNDVSGEDSSTTAEPQHVSPSLTVGGSAATPPFLPGGDLETTYWPDQIYTNEQYEDSLYMHPESVGVASSDLWVGHY